MAVAAMTPTHDPGLLRCIATWRRAHRIVEDWHQTVYDPAYAEYRAALDAVPHHTTTASYDSNGGNKVCLTTANDIHVALALSFGRDARDSDDDDFARCRRELRHALDERNAELQRITDEWIATGLNDRSDRLGDKKYDLWVKIWDYPVRTIADFTLKLETIKEVDDDDYPIDRVLDDLRRIAGRA